MRRASRGPAAVDVADDTFVAAAVELVAEVVADPARWRVWWPDLRLRVTRDRDTRGRQWAVEGERAGSVEIWLEPVLDGTVVHFYLRLEPLPAAGRAARPGPEGVRRTLAWKRHVTALKDTLETGREPGTPACSGAARTAAAGAGDQAAAAG